VGPYTLLEKLGEGGMGVVWKALDSRLGREVALKFLPDDFASDPARLKRFQSEARALAALNHPHIVTIHSIEEVGGRVFMAMELLPGRSLDEMIPAGGLPLREFFDLAIPICDALGAAHARDIIHRDLKPRNIAVTAEGVPKLLDFGLARSRPTERSEASSEESTRTTERARGISGTVPYMAPEQIRGGPQDRRSDIFSLGIVLYEMLAGRRPFRGAGAADVCAAILKDAPTPLDALRPDLPRHLDRLIRGCLEKDPERRTAGAAVLKNELESVRREIGTAHGGEIPSIAVLPFADMSPEKDQDYFCEGIAEEIVNSLTRIQNVHVAARTSSFQFKNAALDTREIADRLGVSAILEGSVRKAGEQLRITVQLVSAADGYHLWSERYDRELADIFAIQEEIADRVTQALKGTLSPRDRRALRQVATADVRAFDYYLRGRKYFNQYARRGIEFALQMFRRAIEIDPAYALAYAGVADCCAFLYLNAERTEAHRECAEEASRRALMLDPELAEAHAARAVALSLGSRAEQADDEFETAMRINPRLFEAVYFYARHCFTRGEHEKATRLYRRASELRPEDYQALLLVGQVYEGLGREAEARDARERGVRRAEAALDLKPDDVRALYMGANGLVAIGERDRGLQWARRARELAPDDTMTLYNLACVFSLAGSSEEALEALESAVRLGFAHRGWVEQDSNLDPLRGQPRFRALMQRWRTA
jgi:non-specific serine/threonine protein kinase